MSYTPYKNQPNQAFWYRAVAGVSETEVDPVSFSSFRIGTTDKVATAGSCFAQHISKYLKSAGIEPYITEYPHPIVQDISENFQYGVYAARYGNIYTSRQLLQLFLRAYGKFVPTNEFWLGSDQCLYDPFRPSIPDGFGSVEELRVDQKRHLECVREMFENLNIFVFTLGLTETWEATCDGSVFPSCPGAIAGFYNANSYRFLNLNVFEIIKDLRDFISLLRSVNASAKLILTVSPVPLVATATNNHVLPATTYSKSVLRVASQEIVDTHSDVDYFPSYEIITGSHTRGQFFDKDYRNIKPEGVEMVMKLFSRHYIDNVINAEIEHQIKENSIKIAQEAMNVFCEELQNDSNFKS